MEDSGESLRNLMRMLWSCWKSDAASWQSYLFGKAKFASRLKAVAETSHLHEIFSLRKSENMHNATHPGSNEGRTRRHER
jgi:hypothetical protein